ncbi:hypothetical protein M9Y10_010164 [Tritrichomonas musculus]|uniref:Surface antigen BspA-like n=1 Tax=Tritrichomonas musculus TaxID=1915356 RepID=A0ABR2IRV0_9EUKA
MLPASADSIIETNSFKEFNFVCLQTKVKQNAFYKCKKFNRLIVLSDELPSNEINNQEDSIFFGSNINSSFFNSIGSEKQESILNLIADLNREDRKEKITNKQNLFKYLMNEKQQLKKRCNKQNALLQFFNKDEQIFIKSEMTENLNENQSLDKIEFQEHATKIGSFFIEAKYLSSGFNAIYNKLLNMKRSNIQNLKIAVYISCIQEIDQLFHNYKEINYVTLDTCITSISNFVCPSLEGISIPSSVTQMGNSVFSDCSSLKQVIIPSSITQIGYSFFYNCSSLKQITIPSSVTQIGNYAFYNCSSLEEITIPSSVTQIGESASSRCSSLTQITIPSFLNINNTGIGSNVKVLKKNCQ